MSEATRTVDGILLPAAGRWVIDPSHSSLAPIRRLHGGSGGGIGRDGGSFNRPHGAGGDESSSIGGTNSPGRPPSSANASAAADSLVSASTGVR